MDYCGEVANTYPVSLRVVARILVVLQPLEFVCGESKSFLQYYGDALFFDAVVASLAVFSRQQQPKNVVCELRSSVLFEKQANECAS